MQSLAGNKRHRRVYSRVSDVPSKYLLIDDIRMSRDGSITKRPRPPSAAVPPPSAVFDSDIAGSSLTSIESAPQAMALEGPSYTPSQVDDSRLTSAGESDDDSESLSGSSGSNEDVSFSDDDDDGSEEDEDGRDSDYYTSATSTRSRGNVRARGESVHRA